MSLHKLHFVLCLGLLLLIERKSCAFGFGTPVNDTMPPEHLRADLHSSPNPNNYGKLEGGGKLVSQDLDPQWLSTDTYFPRGSRRGLMLQYNLKAINVFLAAEIRRPKTVQTFLKEHLLLFLEDAFANDGALHITHRSVETGWGSAPDAIADPSSARYRRLKQKLQPYAQPQETVVAGNGWTVDINVLTDYGAVDHWLVKGTVKPLRIDSFLCEPKEPEGTFYPVPHIH